MSIMVDNIDVTKCSLYKDGKCRSLTHLVQGEYINCNSMCDYGAYARKEQILRLQAENEEFKKENKENLHYLACMTEQRNKLKLALEEIREIAENYFEECGVPDDYFKRNNYSWKQHQIKGLTCKLQQIQDKINEVLKEGE